jgi:hypothetical protein
MRYIVPEVLASLGQSSQLQCETEQEAVVPGVIKSTTPQNLTPKCEPPLSPLCCEPGFFFMAAKWWRDQLWLVYFGRKPLARKGSLMPEKRTLLWTSKISTTHRFDRFGLPFGLALIALIIHPIFSPIIWLHCFFSLVLTTLRIYCTFTYDNNFLLRM